MKKLGIIIDSFSGLTKEEANQQGFLFLPLQVEIDGVVYEDGIADHVEILKKLATANSFLSSLPKLETIEKVLQEALKDFDDVLYIGLSENLSSTSKYVKSFAKDYNNVYVVDNHFSGTQFVEVANHALKLYQNDTPIADIIKNIEYISNQSLTLLVPIKLDYMIKGGRLTGVKKFIMSAISMIPILSYLPNGTVSPIALKRTINGAISKTIAKVLEFCDEIGESTINLIHGIDEKVNNLVKQALKQNNITIQNTSTTSSVVAIHTGPEAFCINVMPKLK
ncbi:DegV family EDD domain-containing protein [Mycoplasma sp. NEAQ87857]|uniref:DegV family protein n=1 Tax=Mycoplasma sp. NEAQ87857 TaxID=2683967 RepID=UPI001317A91E|nr:DegV family protein [Mycoplasma sp. NEAQ87857]QGZ97529.1 DegV family EDD domain-containing protein [Mycoplasma sp. NEAQ87857]